MSNEFPLLNSKIAISGEIQARTGLHIGGGDVGLAIGGADKLVVRTPYNDAPYIPGSSLKGKMRSILERAGYAEGFTVKPSKNDKVETEWQADPCQCGKKQCRVCMVFGVPAEVRATDTVSRTSRLIVRDAHLLNGEEIENWRYLSMHFTEVKTEVAIDRLTSQANPRNFERVPAGARFGLDLILNIHEGDEEKRLLQFIFDGLELLASDYLGGQGTRGYGAVAISVSSVKKLDISRLRDGSGETWSPVNSGIVVPWKRPVELP
jgi:CRISPR-associated protein Csm3